MKRAFGLFVAIQSFVFLAREDRWPVLFYVTRETWLLVLLLWSKDLALAAAAGWAGARLLGALSAATGETRTDSPPPLVEAAWALPVLAAGVALRWTFRETNPPGLWADVVYAAQPLYGGASPPFWGVSHFSENLASTEVISNLYVRFAGAVLDLFGNGESGFFALSALPGAAFVPAVWWLAREAKGPRTALFAALFAALLGWPILLARWSTTSALELVLLACGAAATLRARRTDRAGLALVAGLCVGLSLHTHASAGAVAAGFAAFALREAREKRRRRLVLAAAIGAALAVAPLAAGFATGDARMGGHLLETHLGRDSKQVDLPRGTGALRLPVALASNLVNYTGIFLWTSDPGARTAPFGRVFTPPVGLLVLFGVALAACRRRDEDVLLLLIGGGSLLAGILSKPDSAPNSLRVAGILVPALVLGADLAERIVRVLARPTALSRSLFAAVVAASLLVWESLPALLDAPRVAGGEMCAAETDAGRVLRVLADGPVVIERGPVLYGVVLEAVAHGEDRSRSFTGWPRRSAAGLLAGPAETPFWFYGSRATLGRLAASGLACARGVAGSTSTRSLVVARVKPRA